ncbi:S9 family peptidase [Nocardioidaceae bacterium]|nr:S9 family peptidase [Nocardioidaceae bacterium]
MTSPDASSSPARPPLAPARPVTRTWHGHERTDAYDWLRDPEDAEVLAHLEAENAWTEASTAHLADLRERLVEEIRLRTRETDLSVPSRLHGWWYYSRSFAGKEYGARCRVPVTDPEDWTPPRPAEDVAPDTPALPGEEVVIDLNELAEGHEFFSLGGASVTLDGHLLAYAVDTVGDERYTLRVKDLRTGELLPDELTGLMGGATWAPDGESFYYVTVDESWRPDTVHRHVLGTQQADDEVVFAEPDARFFVGVGRSRSGRFLVIGAESKSTSEIRFLDTERPDLGWRVFAERRQDLEYSVGHAVIGGEDCFVVTHNLTGPDGAVSLAPVEPTAPEDWTDLLPHTPGTRIEGVDTFAGHLLVHQRSGGLTRVRVLRLDLVDGVVDDRLVEFEGEVHTVHAGGPGVFDAPVLQVAHTSLRHPPALHQYDVRTGELTLLKQTPVLSNELTGEFDVEAYEQHRLWVPSVDGVLVPASLVVRSDAARPAPTLLYGYGSYEASMDPGFSTSRLSLLDRGGAFVIAHVRGGGEMGRGWYDDGKMETKQHTFDDFVAVARFLRAEGWSSRIVAEGGSAGGLLMGAVANQAPDAFDGIAAAVPFVDNLTTMLDSSLPLTVTEYEEWGNPEGDPEAYEWIAAYAPYDNVTEQAYPPILATTSLHDTRVMFVEPAKWVARLRATAADGRPEVLLRTEMDGGHGGVSGRYKSWADRAFTLAWILDRLGLADGTP